MRLSAGNQHLISNPKKQLSKQFNGFGVTFPGKFAISL